MVAACSSCAGVAGTPSHVGRDKYSRVLLIQLSGNSTVRSITAPQSLFNSNGVLVDELTNLPAMQARAGAEGRKDALLREPRLNAADGGSSGIATRKGPVPCVCRGCTGGDELTGALEIQLGVDTAFGDLLGQGPGVKVKVAVSQGQLVASILGEKVPKFAVFGPALDEVESLLDVCPSGSILVNEKLREALPTKFRTAEARLEDVVVDANGFLFFLEEMTDHTPVPVIPILQAYTAFKANKAKNARLKREQEEAEAAMEEQTVVEDEDEKKGVVGCGCKSKFCNIL